MVFRLLLISTIIVIKCIIMIITTIESKCNPVGCGFDYFDNSGYRLGICIEGWIDKTCRDRLR